MQSVQAVECTVFRKVYIHEITVRRDDTLLNGVVLVKSILNQNDTSLNDGSATSFVTLIYLNFLSLSFLIHLFKNICSMVVERVTWAKEPAYI